MLRRKLKVEHSKLKKNKNMNKEEKEKINAELQFTSEEEIKEIKRVCGEDFDYWNIPAYLRRRKKGFSNSNLIEIQVY